MHIALIRRAYSPSGGAEKYLLRLAAKLHAKGWTPHLVTSANWPEDAWKWGNVHTIPGKTPIDFANSFAEIKETLKVDYTFSLERVWEADFYRAGDGVHKAWLERLSRHSSGLRNFIRAKKKKHQEILKLETSLYAPPSTTKIIANSNLVAEEIRALYNTPPEQLHVIHNGYNPKTPDSATCERIRNERRKEFGIEDNEVALLFVGSGWSRKGPHFVTPLMKQLAQKGVKFIIAGKGKPASPRPANTIYLGEVKDTRSVYLSADLFVLPTLYDPFSNACLEAASYGLPVITTKDNGFSEALQRFGGGTTLCNPADSSEVLEAISAWLPADKRSAARPHLAELTAHHTEERNLDETLQFVLSAEN